MDLNARKDHFSRAVVRVIAATAGVGTTVPELDQDSEDIQFAAPDAGTHPGAKLSAQLKCSEAIDSSGTEFPFELPVKNYNDLRWPPESLYVPRILIVVHVPHDAGEWMACDPEQIVLRRCAYWLSLAGSAETSNASSVTVKVPTEQVFDAEALLHNLQPPGATV